MKSELDMKRLVLMTAAAMGMLTTPALLAQMDHSGMNHSGMDHSAHGGHQHDGTPNQTPLPEPAQTVFENYLKIATNLAQDSTQDVSENATKLMEAVQKDASRTFPAEVASAAEQVAKAKELKVARQSFKGLSESLIKHLQAQKEHAARFERVFCPMANAKWLQKVGTPVNNPYFGKSMARCGQIES